MNHTVKIIGEDNDGIATPDGLKSTTAITEAGANANNPCPEDLTADEQAKCLKEQEEQKIESPKRRFFVQIRLFNEFWNMAVPVCNEQGVSFWEVGLIDEKNARDQALQIWEDLENRFTLKARKISENELKQEDEETQEALMKWGDSYQVLATLKGIHEKDKPKKSQDDRTVDSEEDENASLE
jgi:hypothetical protein